MSENFNNREEYRPAQDHGPTDEDRAFAEKLMTSTHGKEDQILVELQEEEREMLYETGLKLGHFIHLKENFNDSFGVNQMTRNKFSLTPFDDELARQKEAVEAEEKIQEKCKDLFFLSGLNVHVEDDFLIEGGGNRKVTLRMSIVVEDFERFTKWVKDLNGQDFFDTDVAVYFSGLCRELLKEIKEDYVYEENDEKLGSVVASSKLLKDSLVNINESMPIGIGHLPDDFGKISDAIDGKYLSLYLRMERAMLRISSGKGWFGRDNDPPKIFESKWQEIFSTLDEINRMHFKDVKNDKLRTFFEETLRSVKEKIQNFFNRHKGKRFKDRRHFLSEKFKYLEAEFLVEE